MYTLVYSCILFCIQPTVPNSQPVAHNMDGPQNASTNRLASHNPGNGEMNEDRRNTGTGRAGNVQEGPEVVEETRCVCVYLMCMLTFSLPSSLSLSQPPPFFCPFSTDVVASTQEEGVENHLETLHDTHHIP